MTLYLVVHGRPLTDPERPVSEWELDPSGFDDIWALRESGRLPTRAAWFCAPEPVAQETAQLLTDGDVGVVDELGEHEGTERLVAAVRRIVEVHGDDDVVLIGQGSAWMLLEAALTGREPDPARWRSLGMPDVIEVPPRLR